MEVLLILLRFKNGFRLTESVLHSFGNVELFVRGLLNPLHGLNTGTSDSGISMVVLAVMLRAGFAARCLIPKVRSL